MSWLVFSKPENTSEWSLAQQLDPSGLQSLSLIEFGMSLFLSGKSKAEGITVTRAGIIAQGHGAVYQRGHLQGALSVG